jgi:Zn-dependent protease/CBS domain-containing protein
MGNQSCHRRESRDDCLVKWSLRIGQVAGIGIYVHATFSLLLIWAALHFWTRTGSLGHTLLGVVFILSLFVCVVLHELGHALTARRFGIKTHDITLLPIGGVARLERMPDKPMQELVVALAGPAVNVVIAGVLFVGLAATGGLRAAGDLDPLQTPFFQSLMLLNVMLVLFNLLPAFPMDGGRVLRALLATRLPYVKATRIAASIGQGMAVVFGLVGLFVSPPNPLLLLIALFVWIGAAQEAGAAELRSGLEGVAVRDAMLTEFRTLAPADTLRRAAELILAGSQHDFPVVDGGRVVGILTRRILMAALAERDRDTAVSDIMARDFKVLGADEPLVEAASRLQNSELQTLPVLAHGELAGLLTPENVGEYVMIRSALVNAGTRRGVPPVIRPRISPR